MYNGLLELYLLLCPADRDTHLSATIENIKNIIVVGSCLKEPLHYGVDGKTYFRINIILLTYFHSLKMFKLGLLKPLITSYWTEIKCVDIIFRLTKK